MIKSAAIEMVRLMCGDDVAKKLEIVPLWIDTVQRRIASMSLNVKEQLASIKQGGEHSLQVNENTIVSDDVQLLVYVCYRGENALEEKFLLCRIKQPWRSVAEI